MKKLKWYGFHPLNEGQDMNARQAFRFATRKEAISRARGIACTIQSVLPSSTITCAVTREDMFDVVVDIHGKETRP